MRGKLTIRNVKVMDKVKIGIVEDDEIISRNIQIVLKELGYEKAWSVTQGSRNPNEKDYDYKLYRPYL